MAKQVLRVRGRITNGVGLNNVKLVVLLTTVDTPDFANPLQRHEITRHPTVDNRPMLRKWQVLFARLEPNTLYYVQTRLFRGNNPIPEYTTTRAYLTDTDD